MQIVNFKEPFDTFEKWFNEANYNKAIIEPTAMNIATVDSENRPSSRMVLLKHYDQRGFCFYTNYTSKKGKQLEQNPNISACFFWGILGKQIRIEGKVEKVTDQEADNYFASRRRGSQIGAWASDQSSELESREELEARVKKFEEKFAGGNVSRPPHWSGFRIIPRSIEFWNDGDHRIHDRDLYQLQEDGKSWRKTFLNP